jgi:hypothetical protein
VITVPASTGTIAEPNLVQTWSANQSFNNGTMLLNGSSSGAMTLEAPAAASTYVMTFPAATDTVAVLGTASQVMSGGVLINSLTQSTGNITVNCGARPQQYITGSTSAWSITAPSNDSNCMLFLTNPASSVNIPTLTGFSTNTSSAATAILNATANATFTIFIWRINGVSGINVIAM